MKTVAAMVLCLFVATSSHAGAWGEGSFQNDDALDWVSECVRSASVGPVSDALKAVLAAKYIEAPQGSAAIASAEVIAAALGRPSPKLPDEIKLWMQRQKTDQLTALAPLARKALARIRDSKVSELRQLWSEGKTNRWGAAVAELEARLEK